MRILGIDYGDVRIGLSISDESGTIASPLPTYISQSMRKDADYIAALASEKAAGSILLGLPVNMNGTKGERALKTEAFGRVLNKITGLEVIYKDERMTTMEAERSLKESGLNKQKMHQKVDSVAAQIILQSYLDKKKYNQANELK